MIKLERTLLSTLVLLLLPMSSLIGAELPDYIAPVASQIEQCIAKQDDEGSRNFVSYVRLRQNWEVRWWSLLGRNEIPSDEFIQKHPDLWNAGTVVKLSLKGYCEDIRGVQRLLHGGAPEHKIVKSREFASLQSVVVTQGRVEVGTIGDDGKPVVSVFEKINDKWLLTDVVLQIKGRNGR